MITKFIATRFLSQRLAFSNRTRVIRQFSNTVTAFKENGDAQVTAEKKRIESMTPEGMVLKGLNIYKDGKDPVALKEEEYPEWLWSLLDEPTDENMTVREKQRRERSRDIKEANFMKSKKK